MKNYFETCTTLDEAKQLFRKLALKLHPDKGGKKEDFQQMLNQFHSFKPGKEKFAGEAAQWDDFGPIYSSIIEQLMDIEDIIIEVVGSYIWIGGDTFSKREQIKGVDTQGYMECKFAGQKKKWFFKPAGYKPRVRKEWSMDKIRAYYGSQTVDKNKREKGNALAEAN